MWDGVRVRVWLGRVCDRTVGLSHNMRRAVAAFPAQKTNKARGDMTRLRSGILGRFLFKTLKFAFPTAAKSESVAKLIVPRLLPPSPTEEPSSRNHCKCMLGMTAKSR